MIIQQIWKMGAISQVDKARPCIIPFDRDG